MKVIIGLGNPGKVYESTRHSLGQRIVKELAKKKGVKFKKKILLSSSVAERKFGTEKLILAIPFTFMNESGRAVKRLITRKHIALKDLLVVCDDVDLQLGKIRIRPSGSDGGHLGLRSIIKILGTKDFARLRLGINKPTTKEDMRDFVLSNFNKDEKEQISNVLDVAISCCENWLREGIDKTMAKFN